MQRKYSSSACEERVWCSFTHSMWHAWCWKQKAQFDDCCNVYLKISQKCKPNCHEVKHTLSSA